MPIPVVCASCQAKLVAPDAAAGKRVKCKKCEAVIVVPTPVVEEASDFEFVEPEPVVTVKPAIRVAKPVVDPDDEVVPKKKPKPKKIVEEEDDDDEEEKVPRKAKRKFKAPLIVDEEDDDAPRTPQRATKAKMNPLVLAGLGGAGLLAVIALGAVVWYVAVRDDKAVTTNTTPAIQQPSSTLPIETPKPLPKTTIPAGWTKYEMPGCIVYYKDSLGKPIVTKSKPGDKYDFDKVIIGKVSTTDHLMRVYYTQHAPDSFAEVAKEVAKSLVVSTEETNLGEVMSETAKTLDGQSAREFRVQFIGGKVAFVRIVSANNRIYIFSVSESNLSEQSETYRTFFDNVTLKP